MKHKIEIFENDKFGEIRVIDRNGEAWFVAKDICDCLALGNMHSSLSSLDTDEKDVLYSTDSVGRSQEMTMISEAGLYSLILRSRKPEAKVFKRWVTHEVLPSIRKHGVYMTPSMVEKIVGDPRFLIEIISAYANEQDKRKELEAREEIWGTRTPFGEISPVTKRPKLYPVRGYTRSSRKDPINKKSMVSKDQLHLFQPY